jgi:predicted RNA binding protein YcfA (HicA-like mRNA interferase family)
MTYREVVQRLRQLGCTELPRRGGGSHRKWYNPATERVTVIPDWEEVICGTELSGQWSSNLGCRGRNFWMPKKNVASFDKGSKI